MQVCRQLQYSTEGIYTNMMSAVMAQDPSRLMGLMADWGYNKRKINRLFNEAIYIVFWKVRVRNRESYDVYRMPQTKVYDCKTTSLVVYFYYTKYSFHTCKKRNYH